MIPSPIPFSAVLTFIFAGALLGFLILSAVLVFHWRRYGMQTGAIRLAQTVYFLASACLIVLAVALYLLVV